MEYSLERGVLMNFLKLAIKREDFSMTPFYPVILQIVIIQSLARAAMPRPEILRVLPMKSLIPPWVEEL